MLRNLPQVTKNFLLLNIMFYVVSLVLSSQGFDANEFAGAHYFNSVYFKPFQVITHMFMHSLVSPFHIIFNMFILIMFGGHLERVWGAKRFFIFYVSCGIGALVLYNSIGVYQLYQTKQMVAELGIDYHVLNDILLNDKYLLENMDLLIDRINEMMSVGTLPEINQVEFETVVLQYLGLNASTMVGASGALFGVMAGFAMLFPNTELMLLFPPIPIKAKYLIGGYLVFEVYNSFYASGDHIAHLAHVGGAIVGILFILVWRKTDRTNFY